MIVITTDNVPPRERFEFWRDSIARTALQFRMEPVKHAPRGEARLAAVGGLGVMKCDGSVAARYTRTRAEIGRSQAPRYFVQIQLRTQCVLDHGEKQSLVAVGDGFAADPLREFDMRFAAPENPHKRVLVAGFRKEAVAARVARPDLIHGAVLRHSRPLMRLLTSYLLSGLEIADEMTPEGAALFEGHAVELLAQALRESWAEETRPSEAWREALFMQACRLIRLRYGDPGLGAEPLARELGISTRLLQRIFAQRGETVMRRIFAERIARAAQLLRDPEAAQRTVIDIAFSCGFNDSSHFGRVFAAHMSMTPTDWRRRGPELTAA
jgi:AraC-like DNA-binding protein